MTKETAVGEVTMNAMAHTECRAGIVGDEPAMKIAAVKTTAIRSSPGRAPDNKPTMKPAAPEPTALRARLRRRG